MGLNHFKATVLKSRKKGHQKEKWENEINFKKVEEEGKMRTWRKKGIKKKQQEKKHNSTRMKRKENNTQEKH